MTMDERVEAMKRSIREVLPDGYAMTNQEAGQYAQFFIRAAFPDLLGDKPTHWLAPMEVDNAGDTVKAVWRKVRNRYLGKGDGGALPDWDDLRGAAPDATGYLSSEEWVRKQRDEWR